MFTVTLVQCDGEKEVAAYKDELNRTGVNLESQPGVQCLLIEPKSASTGPSVNTAERRVRVQHGQGASSLLGYTRRVKSCTVNISPDYSQSRNVKS